MRFPAHLALRWVFCITAVLSGMMLFRYSSALIATPLDAQARADADSRYFQITCLREQLQSLIPRDSKIYFRGEALTRSRAAAILWPWADPTANLDQADLVVALLPAEAGSDGTLPCPVEALVESKFPGP